jgi:glucokinase
MSFAKPDEGAPTIGVDLGASRMRAGLVAADGSVLRRIEEASRSESRDALLDQILGAVTALRDDAVAGVCVAVPGVVDERDGAISPGINIPLAGVHLGEWLSERIAVPVVTDRDSNAAAVAEAAYGVGKGRANLLLLTLGTGVGGAAIVDGAVMRGAIGAAGELGHFTLDVQGRPCLGVCTGRGHLEAYASGTAIALEAARVAVALPDGDLGCALAGDGALDARTVVQLAEAGPGNARDVIAEAGFYLGVAVESLINVFNPDVVAIGGSVAAAGELLLGPARLVVEERALRPAADVVELTHVALGGDAGLVGAAVLARPGGGL